MPKESRTKFVNRVMGLNLGSTQGKYSYCNDITKKVLFSLNLAHGDNTNLILSHQWSSKSYAHSIKHIDKILNENYELYIFRTRTVRNAKGEHVSAWFDTEIEKRKLVQDQNGKDFEAISLDIPIAEELPKIPEPYYEGATKKIIVNAYERDAAAREKCIEHHGYICSICEFDFFTTYGKKGKDFIHVHHIIPLSEIRKGYEVDPIYDLIPVCPNCHAMLHRGSTTITPMALKKILNKQKR